MTTSSPRAAFLFLFISFHGCAHAHPAQLDGQSSRKALSAQLPSSVRTSAIVLPSSKTMCNIWHFGALALSALKDSLPSHHQERRLLFSADQDIFLKITLSVGGSGVTSLASNRAQVQEAMEFYMVKDGTSRGFVSTQFNTHTVEHEGYKSSQIVEVLRSMVTVPSSSASSDPTSALLTRLRNAGLQGTIIMSWEAFQGTGTGTGSMVVVTIPVSWQQLLLASGQPPEDVITSPSVPTKDQVLKITLSVDESGVTSLASNRAQVQEAMEFYMVKAGTSIALISGPSNVLSLEGSGYTSGEIVDILRSMITVPSSSASSDPTSALLTRLRSAGLLGTVTTSWEAVQRSFAGTSFVSNTPVSWQQLLLTSGKLRDEVISKKPDVTLPTVPTLNTPTIASLGGLGSGGGGGGNSVRDSNGGGGDVDSDKILGTIVGGVVGPSCVILLVQGILLAFILMDRRS